MNMKNVLKKVLAVGASVAITASGALAAASLSDYPSPFVQDGKIDTMIVVGEKAATADVVGAINIGASLQSAAVSSEDVEVEGSVATSVMVENGMALRKDNAIVNPVIDGLFNVYSNLDDVDFPELLGRKTLTENDANDEYKYSEELKFDSTTAYTVKYGRPDDDLSDDPYFYVDLTKDVDMWTYELSFDKTVDIADFDDNEELEIFGKTFFIDPNNAATGTTLKLYGGSEELSLAVGESKTVSGMDITLIGANTDDNTVTLEIGGQLYTKKASSSVTVGDESIYIKELHLQTIPVESAIVTLSVGSMELELTSGSGIEVDGDSVDGYSVTLDGEDVSTLDGITIAYNPSETDLDEDYLMPGQSVVDEVFGFEVGFDSVTPGLMEDKSKVELSTSSDIATLTFENKDGEEISMDIAKGTTGSDTDTDFPTDLEVNQIYIDDDDYFILNEDISGEDATSYYLQADDVTEDDGAVYVSLKSAGYDETLEIRTGKEVLDTGKYVVGTSVAANDIGGAPTLNYAKDTIALAGAALSEETGSVTAGTSDKYFVYEDADGNQFMFSIIDSDDTVADTVKVAIDGTTDTSVTYTSNVATLFSNVEITDDSTTANGSIALKSGGAGKLYSVTSAANSDDEVWTANGAQVDLVDTGSGVTVKINEDESGQYYDNIAGAARDDMLVTIVDGTGTDSDVEFSKTLTFGNAATYWNKDIQDEDGDYKYGVSAYGTSYKMDVDGESTSMDIYVPAKEQEAVVTVGRDVEVSTSGTSAGGAFTTEKVNALADYASLAKLDSEALDQVGSANMIVVGGPCANVVAAELMGNPANCAEGFEAGKAMVTLFENDDAVSMLVAGYAASETSYAANYIANYRDSELEGDSLTLTTGTEEAVVVEAE